jgi:hypothetical protein
MLVAPLNGGYQVFALGCSEEVSGTFNPLCIRHSSIRNNTQWSTSASGSTAREYILTGGGRIVAGRMCGPVPAGLDGDALFLGTFVGRAEPAVAVRPGGTQLRPDRAERGGGGRPDGVLGEPGPAVLQLCLGGQPEPIPCPIRRDFAEELAASQGDKVVASSNASSRRCGSTIRTGATAMRTAATWRWR